MISNLLPLVLSFCLSGSLPLTTFGQTDASAAAARAYKNYAEYLKNVRELK